MRVTSGVVIVSRPSSSISPGSERRRSAAARRARADANAVAPAACRRRRSGATRCSTARPSRQPAGGASSGSGTGLQIEVAAEIDDQQPIAARRPRSTAARTPPAAMTAPSGRRSAAARITGSRRRSASRSRCKCVPVRVPFALARDPACSARTSPRRPGPAAPPGRPDPSRSETATGTPAAPSDTGAAQLRLVIREIQERRRRRELLPLEQHRRRRTEQRSAPSAPAGGAGERDLVQPACRTACSPPDRGSRDR